MKSLEDQGLPRRGMKWVPKTAFPLEMYIKSGTSAVSLLPIFFTVSSVFQAEYLKLVVSKKG